MQAGAASPPRERAPRSPPRLPAPGSPRRRTRPRGPRARTRGGPARSGTRRSSCPRRAASSGAAAPCSRARRSARREASSRARELQAPTITPSSCASANRSPSIARPTRPLSCSGSTPSRHGTAVPATIRSSAGTASSRSSMRFSRLRNSNRRNISRSSERSGGARTSCGRVAVEVEVAPHRRELLRHARLVGVLDDVLLARGRQLVRVLDHALERAVLRDQLAGGLVADAGDAGDVVGAVALEPDEVRNLLGLDAVARLDALRRVDVHVAHAARRHHQRDVVGDELERVAVGRDDRRLDAGLVGERRERRDHVVGLPALELEVAVAERLDDRPEVRELLAQQVRPSGGGPPCRRRPRLRRPPRGAPAACPRRPRRPSACSPRAA